MSYLIDVILKAKDANNEVGEKVKGLPVIIELVFGIVQSCRVILCEITKDFGCMLVVLDIIT